jgi:hypothetical protein
MLDAFTHINWLAVTLAALAYYILGAAWFTPLFGKTRDRAIGHERAVAKRFGVNYDVVSLLAAVLVAVAMGWVLAAAAPANLGDALLIGLAIGLGVAAAVSVNNALTPHPYVFGALTG